MGSRRAPKRNATRKRPRVPHDAHVATMRVAAADALSTDPEDWQPSDVTAINAWAGRLR